MGQIDVDQNRRRRSVANEAPVLVDAPKTYEVLADPHACQLLEICLGTLQPSDWAARSMRARAAWRVMSRSDVSERLGWTTNGARSEKS